MDVEGPGDLADGLPLIDEFAHERLLIWSHFWWSAKGDAAFAGVDETIPRSLTNKGALEFGNAGKTIKIIRPDGLSVSTHGSSSDCNPASFPLNSSAMARARRSSAPTCRDE